MQVEEIQPRFQGLSSYCLGRARRDPGWVWSRTALTIDHFTVAGLVTWPLHGSEARVDLHKNSCLHTKRQVKYTMRNLIVMFVTVVCFLFLLELTLFWYRPRCFYCANQSVPMLTSLHLHEKCWEVCIKARSPPASLAFMARFTEHTTVKCPIENTREGPSVIRQFVALSFVALRLYPR